MLLDILTRFKYFFLNLTGTWADSVKFNDTS